MGVFAWIAVGGVVLVAILGCAWLFLSGLRSGDLP